MRPFWLVVLAFIPLGCGRPAPLSSGGDWEQQIRSAEEHHRKAFLAKDVAALDSLFADDFIVNSPQNRIIEKNELLGMVRGGALAISTFEQKIESVRRFGDLVVVMGEDRVVYAAPSPAAGQTHRRRFTDLWQLRRDTWSFIGRQASIIP
jgi:ketosteroid isomerase-like protein